MAFMRQEIYKGSYFEIETTNGTEIVPSDVIGRTMGTHVEAFANYLDGKPFDDDEVIECKEGWLARLSAPGYMDCTTWGAYASEEAARAALVEMYGDDDTE